MLVESPGKGLAPDRVQLARTDPLERLEQALSVVIDTSIDVQNTECVCVWRILSRNAGRVQMLRVSGMYVWKWSTSYGIIACCT